MICVIRKIRTRLVWKRERFCRKARHRNEALQTLHLSISTLNKIESIMDAEVEPPRLKPARPQRTPIRSIQSYSCFLCIPMILLVTGNRKVQVRVLPQATRSGWCNLIAQQVLRLSSLPFFNDGIVGRLICTLMMIYQSIWHPCRLQRYSSMVGASESFDASAWSSTAHNCLVASNGVPGIEYADF